MQQTKAISAIEAVMNIGSGFIVAVILWQILAALYGIPMPLLRNLEITTIFTIVSMCRSYIWRRCFERWLNAWLHRMLYGVQDAIL